MHLQTVDSKHQNDYKVWLEREGKRVFEPAGPIPAKVLAALEEEVQRRRDHIEGRWTDLMIANGWLTFSMRGRDVTLTAYPRVPGSRFTRTFDIAYYFAGIYDPTYPMVNKTPIKPEDLGLNKEMGALEVWVQKEEDRREHIRLSTILWRD